jgi:alpha-1,6-mannosyltransferase
MRPQLLIGVVIVLHLVFALAPPLLSSDVFSYVAYGRLGALHGIDPYARPPMAAHGDPVLVYVAHAWRSVLSAYGPLFTLLTYLLAPLGVAAAVWSLKALAALASLAIVAMVWRLARARDIDPRRAVAIVGLNPLVLVYAVGGAHNDLLMLVLAVGAALLIAEGRERAGGAMLVVSAAVKASSFVLLPFAVLGARRPRSVLGGIAAAAIGVGVVAVLAFGDHAAGFATVLQHSQGFTSRSSLPVLLAGFFGDAQVPGWLHTGTHVALAAALGGLLLWTARGGDWLVAGAWAFVAVAATATYLLPWYTIWALPFAAVSRSTRLLVAVVALQAVFTAHAVILAVG